MNALVADEYFSGILTARSRQKSGGGEAKEIDACNGGVFLIGDAAHQFPPAGGFGLNTGVQVSFGGGFCYISLRLITGRLCMRNCPSHVDFERE